MKMRPIAVGAEQWVDKKTGEIRRSFTIVVQDGEKLTGFQLMDPVVKPIPGVDTEVDLSQGFAIRRPFVPRA
jgi:hypothetical protein